ncbi:hypothetical protein ACQEU8_28810 [Streptomyces sp. CA-250714]|uniref:hypothetical protein n=1 Tax=Streptomyces sp. CA-250714 TaxID=3240060 RepID=UPI003D910D6D
MPEEERRPTTDGPNSESPEPDPAEKARAEKSAPAEKPDPAEKALAEKTAPAEKPAPSPRGRLRRLVRGKPGVAVVGAVVGALLAGGTMAWRAGELPFFPGDVCWDSLSSGTVDRLFSDGEIRAKELPLQSTGDVGRYSTECRLQRWEDDQLKWEISAEVQQLDRYKGRGVREWTREFLSPTMAPLGRDIPGMVSDSRAWVALPESCEGGGEDDPPAVVSLSSGSLNPYEDDPGESRKYRAALADAVVELTNGVLSEKGCQGRYPEPDKLAPLTRTRTPEKHGEAELCGLKGVRLPSWLGGSKDSRNAVRSSTDLSGPAHSCEYGRYFTTDGTRFTTIEDPRLANFVTPLAYDGPVRFAGDGYGRVSGDLSAYVATCQTGPVAFLIQQEDTFEKHSPTAELLPSYVAAEAKRIGCGKVKVTGPKTAW